MKAMSESLSNGYYTCCHFEDIIYSALRATESRKFVSNCRHDVCGSLSEYYKIVVTFIDFLVMAINFDKTSFFKWRESNETTKYIITR